MKKKQPKRDITYYNGRYYKVYKIITANDGKRSSVCYSVSTQNGRKVLDEERRRNIINTAIEKGTLINSNLTLEND